MSRFFRLCDKFENRAHGTTDEVKKPENIINVTPYAHLHWQSALKVRKLLNPKIIVFIFNLPP